MLYDRIKWHYDSSTRHNDPDAVRAYVQLSDGAAQADAASLWVPDGGYQVHVTDHAEFQRPDPQWAPPPALRGMIIRVSDGTYREPSFATDFRIMDEMLQRGELDYCMWYHLPSPNVTRQQALNGIAGQLRESGVQWGRPGHGFSIDDEPTPYHDALNGQPMVDLRNALQDIYQREDLHYTGAYSANYHYIPELGWPLWLPWPLVNGNMPSWTANLVMQQWGVADPGGAPGFPNRPVDVNHLFDVATLDRLTGRTEGEDDLTPEQDARLSWIEAQLKAVDFAALPLIRQNYNWLGRTQNADFNALDLLRPVYNSTAGGTLPAIQKSVDALSAPAVDVDALAKALVPLLNSGTDAHAVAVEVAGVLGERLATGGTRGGAT